MKYIFLIIIIFTGLSGGDVFSQEPFKYQGVKLTTPQMFSRTAERLRLEWVKNKAAAKGELKRNPDVMMLLQKCVELFPGNLTCSLKFIEAYDGHTKERGFYGSAADKDAQKYLIAALTGLLMANPKNDFAYYRRGILYFELGQYELAIADFSENIRLSKTAGAGDYCVRARVYMAIKKYDPAIADYKKALSFGTGSAEAAQGLINIYLEQNKGEDALSVVNSMIGGDGEVKGGWIEERSRVYTAMKKYDLAMKDVDELERLWQGSANVFYNRGLVFAAQGEKEKAIAEFRKAYEKMPYDPRFKEALEKLGVKP
ncbi:MAG TPA: tetratricopeptide repeat protein [Pyrinomonadaceae bacterium]|jgi:tetratricopeptide (TPR) repeat protein|nr:tetratricopeptide repeat protein [Pyrinomonadaceae bacterium]